MSLSRRDWGGGKVGLAGLTNVPLMCHCFKCQKRPRRWCLKFTKRGFANRLRISTLHKSPGAADGRGFGTSCGQCLKQNPGTDGRAVRRRASVQGFVPRQSPTVFCRAEYRKSCGQVYSQIAEESAEVSDRICDQGGVFEVSKILSQDQKLHDVPVPRLMEHLVRVPKMEVEEADLKVFSQDRFQQCLAQQFTEVPKMSSKDQTMQRSRAAVHGTVGGCAKDCFSRLPSRSLMFQHCRI